MVESRKNRNHRGGLLAAVAVSGTLLMVSATAPSATSKPALPTLEDEPIDRLVGKLREKVTAESGVAFEPEADGAVTKLVQFYNFQNCYNPSTNWRKC
jgi:hypothetical protein